MTWNVTYNGKPITGEQAKKILTDKAIQAGPGKMAEDEAKRLMALIESAKAGDKDAARVLYEHTLLEFTQAA